MVFRDTVNDGSEVTNDVEGTDLDEKKWIQMSEKVQAHEEDHDLHDDIEEEVPNAREAVEVKMTWRVGDHDDKDQSGGDDDDE